MWEAKAPVKEPGREKGGEERRGRRARDWQGHSPAAKGKLKNSETSVPMDKRWSSVCARRGFPVTKSELSALSSTTQCKAPQVSLSLFQPVCLALSLPASPSLFPCVCTATKTTRYGWLLHTAPEAHRRRVFVLLPGWISGLLGSSWFGWTVESQTKP